MSLPQLLSTMHTALEKWEQHAASESGLMNIILGNTCFTTGVEHHCKQSLSVAICWLQACVEDCTAKMDANTYTTYTQFFSDVFNMCLFLQTQNFQEWTTALVQDMHAQTVAANTSLSTIKGQLHSQQQVLQQSLQSLADLQTVQLQVAKLRRRGWLSRGQWGRWRSSAFFHSVKLGVRLGVLGVGAGLVLWMLLKRHAAQQRKEELFQELKRSLCGRLQLQLSRLCCNDAEHCLTAISQLDACVAFCR
ncbi:hypothetical protein COO60DRAFT_1457854 [Scenedesmus sp. NREL 46B-D3]|nr:hypothetical protein COO60DRAFT_1457854 [Scenedesmus sp. NREL 46B-D3]